MSTLPYPTWPGVREPLTRGFMYTGDELRAAIASERERLALPKSYGGSTFGTWGNQPNGCTVCIHFTDAAEARSWFDRLLEQRRGNR